MKSKLLRYGWLPFFSLALLTFIYPKASEEPAVATMATTIPQDLDLFIERQNVLPRYEEGGYTLLGRSPVVDALLGDPFYLPTYADTVAKLLKTTSDQNSLYNMTTVILRAGGLPVGQEVCSLTLPYSVPERFLECFGEATGAMLYSYWTTFMDVSHEIESVLSVISPKEKEWLQKNYDAFFFGVPDKDAEYDFFTTESVMPLKFFTIASRIDLVKLGECARRLGAIVDDAYRNWDALTFILLKDDFVWEEQGLTFMISSQEHVTHKREADFFIDIGGNNTFLTNAGGTQGKRAAALHIDYFGGNTFIGDTFVQGSGFLGVGILASFSGNNIYKANAYSQGSGFLGIGILWNMGSKNQYQVNFGGQSFALFGSSLLWNKGGNNQYSATQGMAQAASSTLGIAFLVDNEGGNTFVAGQKGKGQTRYGGIGQGGSIGARNVDWTVKPSFYGGVSFFYNGGSNNVFKTSWIGQGSAYFLGAGIVVEDGSNDDFYADYDAQGQGLHMSAGLLLQRGGHSHFNGGWGSLGVGGDRSVGMLINTGGYNSYEGTDQSIGTARKPKALGVFIDTVGHNNYVFKKFSNANVQKPQYPTEWPSALFMSLGGNNHYPDNVDDIRRGNDQQWNVDNHSVGVNIEVITNDLIRDLFAKFPASPRVAFPFDPIHGWQGNTAYYPLKQATTKDEIQSLVSEIHCANYDRRRQLYETIELARFAHPDVEIDLSELLADPAHAPPDQLNYGILWAIKNRKNSHLNDIIQALNEGTISSDFARKMAILLVGTMGTKDEVPLLAKIMTSDPIDENRFTAALALSVRATPDSKAILQSGLQSDSETVRYAIARALLNSKQPYALELVKPLFNDPSFYVRRAAALTAISLHDKEGIPVLIDTFQYDTLDTTDNYGDNLYNDLASFVGVNFGPDNAAWGKWWNRVKDSFEFPKKPQ